MNVSGTGITNGLGSVAVVIAGNTTNFTQEGNYNGGTTVNSGVLAVNNASGSEAGDGWAVGPKGRIATFVKADK